MKIKKNVQYIQEWLLKIFKRKNRTANPEQPFSLPWPVHKILSTTPGKRWVVKSTWQHKPVVIKIFSSKRTADRALNNFNELRARGILVPELLKIQPDKTGQYTCLIFEELPHVPLKEQARQTPMEIAKKLIPLIANQHALGIVQGDMHLNNFIMMDDLIYTIDTDTIRFYKKSAGKRISLKSLAQLIVQFFPEVKTAISELHQVYCEQRGWQASPRSLIQLRADINSFTKYRKKKFLESLFREGSAIRAEQNFFSRTLWRFEVNTPAFREFIQHPETAFKHGNNSAVAKVTVNGIAYMVKRYTVKNTRLALLRLLWPMRAAHAWQMANLFQFLHIPALAPAALIEKRWGFLCYESYFVTEFVEGNMLSSLEIPQAQQAKIQAQVLALIAKMHAEHITYGDMQLANILISTQGQPMILDLDSTKMHDWSFLKTQKATQDNARFLIESMQRAAE